MKKMFILLLLTLTPFALFASEGAHNVETDILQRTVNFVIFAAILYYLLADKIKAFFADRTQSIQAELDKVQDTLKESEQKVADAAKKLEEAKKLASEIVSGANEDIEKIKAQIAKSVEDEIAHLEKNFDNKTEAEIRKAKVEVVEEILNELLSDSNLAISQDELANIVMKKVA